MSQSENLNRNFCILIEIYEGDNFIIMLSGTTSHNCFLSLCKTKIMCNDWTPNAILLFFLMLIDMIL